MLTEVLKQDREALQKMSPAGVAWGEASLRLNRPKDQLYRDWINRILPTLRRHLAGKQETLHMYSCLIFYSVYGNDYT